MNSTLLLPTFFLSCLFMWLLITLHLTFLCENRALFHILSICNHSKSFQKMFKPSSTHKDYGSINGPHPS